MNRAQILIAFATLYFSPCVALAEETLRQWRSTNGKRVDAIFEAYDEKTKTVTLLVRTEVKLSSLDKEARDYIEAKSKAITYKYRGQKITPLAYRFDVRLDSDENLPTIEQLRQISDELATEQPGYDNYGVFFLLPGMDENSGAFATAHRQPECKVKINSIFVPNRIMKRVREFYGEEPWTQEQIEKLFPGQ